MKDIFGRPIAMSALIASLFLGAAGCCPHHHHHHDEMTTKPAGMADDDDKNEQKIDESALPEPVKAALAATMPNGKVGEVEKETYDGKTVYEVHVNVSGDAREVKFTPDGSVISNKEDKD